MDKILILLFFLAIASIGFVFFFKQPPFIYEKIFGNSNILGLTNKTGNQNAQTPGSKSPDRETGLPVPSIYEAKSNLEDTAQTTINELKDNLYDTAQNSLNQLFDKEPQNASVDVQITTSNNSASQNPVIIDLSKENNIKLNLFKNTKYYLQFQNMPINYCIYINNNKYLIDNQKVIALEFSIAGSYPIKANSCDLNDKNIGEVNVQ